MFINSFKEIGKVGHISLLGGSPAKRKGSNKEQSKKQNSSVSRDLMGQPASVKRVKTPHPYVKPDNKTGKDLSRSPTNYYLGRVKLEPPEATDEFSSARNGAPAQGFSYPAYAHPSGMYSNGPPPPRREYWQQGAYGDKSGMHYDNGLNTGVPNYPEAHRMFQKPESVQEANQRKTDTIALEEKDQEIAQLKLKLQKAESTAEHLQAESSAKDTTISKLRTQLKQHGIVNSYGNCLILNKEYSDRIGDLERKVINYEFLVDNLTKKVINRNND